MTNKLVLRDVDQVMADYTPIYNPLYPLFLGKSVSYAEEVGKLTFRRLEAMGDIRTKHITPKDTEIREISVTEKTKVFKKYFFANRYVQSSLQDASQNEDVVKQVLEEAQRYQDDLFLLGEGTSASTMVNNGLFWSSDANYSLQNSIEIAKATDGTHLVDLHAQVVTAKLACDVVAGRKTIIFYGSLMLPKVNGIYLSSSRTFKEVLAGALGAGYGIVEMPADVTPANTNGFIIANYDQCKLHYTALPKLLQQGINDEKLYSWHNFLQGSMMLEVLANKGIYRQPTTFAA